MEKIRGVVTLFDVENFCYTTCTCMPIKSRSFRVWLLHVGSASHALKVSKYRFVLFSANWYVMTAWAVDVDLTLSVYKSAYYKTYMIRVVCFVLFWRRVKSKMLSLREFLLNDVASLQKDDQRCPAPILPSLPTGVTEWKAVASFTWILSASI